MTILCRPSHNDDTLVDCHTITNHLTLTLPNTHTSLFIIPQDKLRPIMAQIMKDHPLMAHDLTGSTLRTPTQQQLYNFI